MISREKYYTKLQHLEEVHSYPPFQRMVEINGGWAELFLLESSGVDMTDLDLMGI